MSTDLGVVFLQQICTVLAADHKSNSLQPIAETLRQVLN